MQPGIDPGSDFFRALVEAIGDPVSVQDRSFRVIYQNEAHRTLVGNHAGEWCFAAYSERDDVCPNCPLAQAFADGATHTWEEKGSESKGILSVEITASPLRNSAGEIIAGIEVVRNTSEATMAVAALRAAEEKFRTLVEQSLVGIFIYQDGRFLYVNPKTAEIFGYSPEEMTSGLSIGDLLSPEHAAAAEEDVRRLISGKLKGVHEFRQGIRKDGSPVTIECQASLTTFEGKPAIIGTLLDVTDRTAMEIQIEKARRLESLGSFASGIANEFNNILTAVIGNLAIAKMYAKPGYEVFDVLVEAEKASFRARDLTAQLLRFSGGPSPVVTTVSFQDAIRDVASLIEGRTGVSAVVSVPDDLWPVRADEALMLEAISNIARYVAVRGIISFRAENLEAADLPGTPTFGSAVCITIENRSLAVPPEVKDRIFDPYLDVETGMGLASAHAIVLKHRGQIVVESRPAEGTRFLIYLPADHARPHPGRDFAGTTEQMAGRVLVMDDEELVRIVAGRLLLQCGYEAVLTRSGNEMLDAYREASDAGRPFDAVILDLIIQDGMGGEEAIEHLLRLDPHARAIVSSGYANDPAMTEFRKYGFRAFLAKPYRLDELGRVLCEVTGRRH